MPSVDIKYVMTMYRVFEHYQARTDNDCLSESTVSMKERWKWLERSVGLVNILGILAHRDEGLTQARDDDALNRERTLNADLTPAAV